MKKRKSRPRILVSNDDGIWAPGIKCLAEQLAKIGEVVVVAPSHERSTSGHSLTLHNPLRIKEIEKNYFAVEGTPADSVYLGINQIMKRRVDLVFAGINRGPNMGNDIYYSGTVAAAREGAFLNIPAVAISLVTSWDDKKQNYLTAADFALKVANYLLKDPLPTGVILNINVPNVEKKKVKKVEITKLGTRYYSNTIEEKIDPRGRKYYWLGGDYTGFKDIAGSDCKVVAEKGISVTPLLIDSTHYAFCSKLRPECFR